MAKFRFRLDSILKLKEEQKKQIELELASIRYRRLKAEEELRSIMKAKNDVWEQIIIKKNRQVLDFQADYYYMEALEKEITNSKNRIEKIQTIENKVLSEIVSLDKEKKTMEKLKEKKRDEFRKETNRSEQNFLDDISQRIKV